jgi:hypothetical protein
MKNLLSFKLFESSNDYVENGFKFSELYIRDRLYYLTDIGFVLDNDNIDSLYIDSNGNKAKLVDATSSVYFLKLIKKIGYKLKYRSVETGYSYPETTNIYYYLNDTDSLIEIAETISSFSAHFEDIHHNITYKSSSIEISFYIYSEIPSDIKQSEKLSIIESKARDMIDESISKFHRKFSDTKTGLTKKFKEESNRNKLRESSYGFIGGNNFKIKIFNTEGLSKSVINTNFSKIENIVDISHWNIPNKFGKVDFRKINEEDIKKLYKSIDNDRLTINYLSDRYLGLQAVILDIDYDSWLEHFKKDIEENFDTYRRNYYF